MALTGVLLSVVCLVAADDKIVFPGQIETSSCKHCNVKIPLEMILRLNTIKDEDQLSRRFIINSVADEVSDRLGEVNGLRVAENTPKNAGCIPALKSITLRKSNDPSVYYFPSCTRVEQCGGCCNHERLSCQAVETEQINFKVTVLRYLGNNKMDKSKEIVTVEKHKRCKCDCIVKEKDCNELQKYLKNECRCVCINSAEKYTCELNNNTMLWNTQKCACECRQVHECSYGSYFSHSSCSCEPAP